MKTVLTLLSLLLLLPAASGREVKVYRGDSRYASDILCTVRDGKVYKGRSSYASDILLRIDGNDIYRRNSTYRSDIVLNLRENGGDVTIHEGRSSYLSDIRWTLRDGFLYNGRSSYRSDIVANLTARNGPGGSTQGPGGNGIQVHRSTSTYRSDLLFTIDGPLSPAEFIAVWYAVNHLL
ncbi:MAG: hypothetical protein IJ156_02180 [Bacteroidales bacterium]|nr:hypothetical protein [Bacteroidales bacterium]